MQQCDTSLLHCDNLLFYTQTGHTHRCTCMYVYTFMYAYVNMLYVCTYVHTHVYVMYIRDTYIIHARYMQTYIIYYTHTYIHASMYSMDDIRFVRPCMADVHKITFLSLKEICVQQITAFQWFHSWSLVFEY